MTPKILLIEDDNNLGEALEKYLHQGNVATNHFLGVRGPLSSTWIVLQQIAGYKINMTSAFIDGLVGKVRRSFFL